MKLSLVPEKPKKPKCAHCVDEKPEVIQEKPLGCCEDEQATTYQEKPLSCCVDDETFNGTVRGPFIRAKVGDIVELSLTNKDPAGNPHNIDCHAFTGPGGGAAVTTAEEGETKVGRFKLLYPGLYVYHCAAAPVPVHIADGM
ncbi:copper-containing protein [Fusarium coicis]|nr:copper-containing protein [Fusarium coicis]